MDTVSVGQPTTVNPISFTRVVTDMPPYEFMIFII
jgi:hypothetical protein